MVPNRTHSRRAFLAACAGLSASAAAPFARAQDDTARYMVGAESDAAVDEAKRRAEHVRETFDIGDITVVVGVYTRDDAESLRSHEGVAYVKRDEDVSVPDPVPDEPPAATTDAQRGDQILSWGHDLLGAEYLHEDDYTGNGVSVGVIDTGIDADHPDIGDAVAATESFLDTDSIHDEYGHGTQVAGIIGARDNGRGTVGVAPESDLYIGKVLDGDGDGSAYAAAQAVSWCVDNDVDVINMSTGGCYKSRSERLALEQAAENGIFVASSAGNDGPCSGCVTYPAAFDDVFAVGATTSEGNLASFSSTGPLVDAVAPGLGVQTLTPGGGTGRFSGTSAAPRSPQALRRCLRSKTTAPRTSPRRCGRRRSTPSCPTSAKALAVSTPGRRCTGQNGPDWSTRRRTTRVG